MQEGRRNDCGWTPTLWEVLALDLALAAARRLVASTAARTLRRGARAVAAAQAYPLFYSTWAVTRDTPPSFQDRFRRAPGRDTRVVASFRIGSVSPK